MKKANEIAYDYIKGRILDGTYMPAQRLLEAQLAEEIGVSRNTIKKALLKIEQEKLIIIEENKGATIRSLSMNEVMEYYEVREMLETLIAQYAVENITDAEIEELDHTLNEMHQLMEKKQYDEYSQRNRLFHNIIYKASNRPITVDMILGIKTQLNRFQIRTMLVPGRADESFQEHTDILLSMKRHDGEMAKEALRKHMQGVKKTIIAYQSLLF